MAVPATIADLTTNEATNSPADSESITATTRPSDYLRAHAAIIKTLAGSVATDIATAVSDHAALADPHPLYALESALGTASTKATGTTAGTVPLVGTKSATKIIPGLNYDIPQIQPITATVAANALTLGLGPTTLDFRNTPITSGTVNTRNLAAAISLVVPDTATLGTTNAIAARLVLIALDNAGTIELAVVNLAGGNNLDETTLISTTAISATADSASVIYSTTARTSLPFRVVGLINITEATAGTWATAPTTVQGAGGNAATAMMSLGYGSIATNPVRALTTTYYNTEGTPRYVFISAYSTAGTAQFTVSINGGGSLNIGQTPSANAYGSCAFVVPPGASYAVTLASGVLGNWTESN